jgi:hypothetical protein
MSPSSLAVFGADEGVPDGGGGVAVEDYEARSAQVGFARGFWLTDRTGGTSTC